MKFRPIDWLIIIVAVCLLMQFTFAVEGCYHDMQQSRIEDFYLEHVK